MFKCEFEVRDSELDMQGIVNNTNYPIYLEHARHQFFKSIGISFPRMTQEGYLFVLVSSHLEFKHSLLPNDRFYVTCEMKRLSFLKIGFEQEIRLLKDDSLILKAENVGVILNAHQGNKPFMPDFFERHLG